MPQTGSDLGLVDLGSLGRIQRDSSHCRLCRIFNDVIQSQGAVYVHDKPIPTDNRAAFYVDTKYYGFITVSPLDGEGTSTECYYYVRRLSLKGVLKNAETGEEEFRHGFAFFSNILQVYQPDADLVPEHQKILFGGRIRPEIIDFDLLRQWITICDTQHEVTCNREDSEDGVQCVSVAYAWE